MSGNDSTGVAIERLFVSAGECSAADREAILMLWQEVWPSRPEGYFEEIIEEFGSFPETPLPAGYALLRIDGSPVAQCRIFPRTVASADGRLTVMALAGVCVDPDRRGLGLGRRIVQEAFANVDSGVYGSSLFQTSFRVAPFYENLGCRRVGNTFVNSLAGSGLDEAALRRSVFWDDVVMVYPADCDWPEGEIDLLGGGY